MRAAESGHDDTPHGHGIHFGHYVGLWTMIVSVIREIRCLDTEFSGFRGDRQEPLQRCHKPDTPAQAAGYRVERNAVTPLPGTRSARRQILHTPSWVSLLGLHTGRVIAQPRSVSPGRVAYRDFAMYDIYRRDQLAGVAKIDDLSASVMRPLQASITTRDGGTSERNTRNYFRESSCGPLCGEGHESPNGQALHYIWKKAVSG